MAPANLLPEYLASKRTEQPQVKKGPDGFQIHTCKTSENFKLKKTKHISSRYPTLTEAENEASLFAFAVAFDFKKKWIAYATRMKNKYVNEYTEIYQKEISKFTVTSASSASSTPDSSDVKTSIQRRNMLNCSERKELNGIRKKQKLEHLPTTPLNEFIQIFRDEDRSEEELNYFKKCMGHMENRSAQRLAQGTSVAYFRSRVDILKNRIRRHITVNQDLVTSLIQGNTLETYIADYNSQHLYSDHQKKRIAQQIIICSQMLEKLRLRDEAEVGFIGDFLSTETGSYYEVDKVAMEEKLKSVRRNHSMQIFASEISKFSKLASKTILLHFNEFKTSNFKSFKRDGRGMYEREIYLEKHNLTADFKMFMRCEQKNLSVDNAHTWLSNRIKEFPANDDINLTPPPSRSAVHTYMLDNGAKRGLYQQVKNDELSKKYILLVSSSQLYNSCRLYVACPTTTY